MIRDGIAWEQQERERLFEDIARKHPTIIAIKLEPSGWMVSFDSDWNSSKRVDGISRSCLIDAVITAHESLSGEGA